MLSDKRMNPGLISLLLFLLWLTLDEFTGVKGTHPAGKELILDILCYVYISFVAMWSWIS